MPFDFLSSVHNLNHQPIVSRLDAGRTLGRDLVVVDLVVHMGQIGHFGLEALDPAERHGEVGVAGGGLVAEAVDDPDVQVYEGLEGRRA